MSMLGTTLAGGLALIGASYLVWWGARLLRCPVVPDRLCVQYTPQAPETISKPDLPPRLGFGIRVENTGDLTFTVVRAEAKIDISADANIPAQHPRFHETRTVGRSLLPGERYCAVVDIEVGELLGVGAPIDPDRFEGTIRAEIQTFAGQRSWTPWAPTAH
jgi:hypothetical protein